MERPRFVYRGNAVGVAGHIHKPEDSILWVQGASSLPVIGGYSRSSVDRVAHGEYLSADSVKTQSNGDFSEKDKAFKTLTTSSVRHVSITHRLTAELLEATLLSTHPVDGSQPTIVPTGTNIANMRLDGYAVNVKLDVDLFTKHCTLDSLSDAFTNDDAFYKRYGSRFMSVDATPGPTAKGKRKLPVVAGYTICSIVGEIRTDHPKAKVNGHVITLNGFGTIYLGELLITSVSRRLTLLRAKLGSPVTGDIACSEVEDNGILII